MLQASSRAGLMKALGGGNFKHDWFATNVVRMMLLPLAFPSCLNAVTCEPSKQLVMGAKRPRA